MNVFEKTGLWWFVIAIGLGLFGTSYLALEMFRVGNNEAGILFGIGFGFGWFKTYQICSNDGLEDNQARTILSILLIAVTGFVVLGMVYIIGHSATSEILRYF